MPRYLILHAGATEALQDDALFVVKLTKHFATKMLTRRALFNKLLKDDPPLHGLRYVSPATVLKCSLDADLDNETDDQHPIPRPVQESAADGGSAQFIDLPPDVLDDAAQDTFGISTDCDYMEVDNLIVSFEAARRHYDCPDTYWACVYWDVLEPELLALLDPASKEDA